MAARPIFLSTGNMKELFFEVMIDFKFYNGFSVTQKSKSIQSLHENSIKAGYKNILEVSTKSDNKLGWQLSAFNLMVDFENDSKISLESAFQGSKIFEGGIQYKDIYKKDSMSAKKDERLKKSGNIIGFEFDGEYWNNEPKTAFYDYLYIKTLYTNHKNIIKELLEFDVFTDIEFNPHKSINCQAKTCAILVSLVRLNLLDKAILSKESFVDIVYKKEPIQLTLF